MDHDRFKQIASLKFQLKVSLVLLLFYALAYVKITEHEKAQMVAMAEGVADSFSKSDHNQEITWEILVVDRRLHEFLWKKYREADEVERKKALFAILIMAESIDPAQAENLVEGIVRYDGETTSTDHREKLHSALEKLGASPNNKGTLKGISSYAVLQLREKDSFYKVEQIRLMMKRIHNAINESPYKYCLDGSVTALRECASEMVREKGAPEKETLWKYAKSQVEDFRRLGIAYAVLARIKDPRPKAEISTLLTSNSPVKMSLAMELIREYNLKEYVPQLQGLRDKTQMDNVKNDLDATIRYLQLPEP